MITQLQFNVLMHRVHSQCRVNILCIPRKNKKTKQTIKQIIYELNSGNRFNALTFSICGLSLSFSRFFATR